MTSVVHTSGKRIALIGLGVVGGSLAYDAQAAGYEVVGYDIDPASAALAAAAGVQWAADVPRACQDAALVIVAAPPAACPQLITQVAACTSAPLMDVASVKEAVIAALPALPPGYVPAHPMAGGSGQGFAGAGAGRFADMPWVVTPTAATTCAALCAAVRFIDSCGARTLVLSPSAHDAAVARASHLVQILGTLMSDIGPDAPRVRALGGRSYRDLVRVAGSDAVLWSDILCANRVHVDAALGELIARLQHVQRQVRAGDALALHDCVAAGHAPARELTAPFRWEPWRAPAHMDELRALGAAGRFVRHLECHDGEWRGDVSAR